MRNYIVIVVLFSCFSKTLGQEMGNHNYNRADAVLVEPQVNAEADLFQITVSVNGLLNVSADVYVAVFNVTQVGDSAQNTDALSNRRISMFRNELHGLGIDSSSVKVDFISFVPKYGLNVVNKLFSKSYNEVPTGFIQQKNVTVKFTESTMLQKIISAAAKYEIYDLIKVDSYRNDLAIKRDELRMKCMDLLKAKIKSYEQLGFKLDTMSKSVNDQFITITPQARYKSYEAISRPSLQALKRSTGDGFGKVREADVSSSSYYEAVGFEQFDLIIDPVIDQPLIQVLYEIEVKFLLKNHVTQAKTIHVITPSGELKRVTF